MRSYRFPADAETVSCLARRILSNEIESESGRALEVEDGKDVHSGFPKQNGLQTLLDLGAR